MYYTADFHCPKADNRRRCRHLPFPSREALSTWFNEHPEMWLDEIWVEEGEPSRRRLEFLAPDGMSYAFSAWGNRASWADTYYTMR